MCKICKKQKIELKIGDFEQFWALFYPKIGYFIDLCITIHEFTSKIVKNAQDRKCKKKISKK